jgi:dUTP pyrophosphatase
MNLSNQHLQYEAEPHIVDLEVKLVHPLAKLPCRNRSTDVGYDIYASENAVLAPGRATIVQTGVRLSAPPGYYYTIEGRSSLWSIGIFPNRGIIDSTYCGDMCVSLVNVTGEDFHVHVGDRIAQLILHKQYNANFRLVEEFSPLYNQRGENGFGSSGR